MVSEPYGGKLLSRVLTGKERERILEEAREMPKIEADLDALLDAEKIAIGAYSPLVGFMGLESYLKVLYENCLPNGLPWTIPIIFTPHASKLEAILDLKEGEEIILEDTKKRPVAVLHLEEKFAINKSELARNVFATLDPNHPNIQELQSAGSIALAGEVKLIQRVSSPFIELLPSETRTIFKQRGWRTIAGYQCRNPPHLAHEYIQRCALELIDGLFIHPVVGKLKKGDYKPEVIMQAYDALVRNYYPESRVLLSPLSIAMRYAGPKAAIFLAIIRKNYGCTHFILGRDIAGVGNYYDPLAAHRIFEEIDIGIEPLKFGEIFYCKRCGWAASNKTCKHKAEDRMEISQTNIRAMLKNGKEIPSLLVRPEVAEILSKKDVLMD